jgi:hypothetical protein
MALRPRNVPANRLELAQRCGEMFSCLSVSHTNTTDLFVATSWWKDVASVVV